MWAHLEHALCLPNSPRSTHHPRQHNQPHELKHENQIYRGSAYFLRSDRSRASLCPTDCRHSWGGISRGYLKYHDKIYQQQCFWHSHSPQRHIWEVDTTWTPWVLGYCQEDDVPSSRPNCDLPFRRQITSQVLWHHRNLIHATPSHEHCIRHHSQEEHVWVGNSWVEQHAKSTEDMGRVQKVFGRRISNYGRQQASLYRMQEWTMRPWCAMWWQDCKNSCSRINPWLRLPRLLQ